MSAEQHLSAADRCLAGLIEQYGPCPLGAGRRDPFDALVVAIVGQQLSLKAAAVIRERLQTYIGATRPFFPGHFLLHTPDSLRMAGLSAAKARWILNLARMASSGEVDLDWISEQPDGEAIEALVRLPGIGQWTAEMFLIFSLGRPDVLSLGDAGLRRAVKALYALSDLDDAGFRQLAEPWRPYRSIASWYLWRSLDQR